jgi:KDO2-lipid IV(A) lauroyltransferase
MDLDARNDGIFVDFFGRPAATLKSPAILSLRYGSPVIPLNIYRENGIIWMAYQPIIEPETFRKSPDRILELTQRITSKLEEFIRLRPEQWIWTYRRWRTLPEGYPRWGGKYIDTSK